MRLSRIRKKLLSFFKEKQERRHAMAGPSKRWKMKRAFQIRFLKEQGLRPDQTLVEIGCGTLRGGIPLIEYLDSGNYLGIEVREEVLIEAQRELEDCNLTHKKPQLIVCDDLSALDLKRPVDVIWAFSVLIHMQDPVLHQALDFVSKHLKDSGVFYANVNIGHRQDGHWQGFPVVARSLAFYKQTGSQRYLDVSCIGALSDFGHHSGKHSEDAQAMLAIRQAIH